MTLMRMFTYSILRVVLLNNWITTLTHFFHLQILVRVYAES